MSMPRPKRTTFRTNRESSTTLGQHEDTRPTSWTEAIDGKQEGDFRSYSVKETFAQGDGLTHPKFGPGIVVEVEATKIAVLFEVGERRLAHGMS